MPSPPLRLRTLLRFAALLLLALVGAFAALLAFDSFAPPLSTLMLGRELTGKGYQRTYVRLASIAPAAVLAVVTSEDARFCQNDGVDWDELRGVLRAAGKREPSRGASTLTMQTAKNLFLWPGRSKIRKGIEIVIALVLGKIWTKPHTLEVYLNIAEWGDGLFGIDAAAQRYFHKPASQLDAREAALLATALPNPRQRNPAHPRPMHRLLAASLVSRTYGEADFLDCLPK